MSRHPLLSLALAATVLLGLSTATTASASPEPTAGPPHAPHAVSLVGTHLHLAGGRVVTLPRAAGRWPVLLGTVPRGWVVASGQTFRLVRPDGRVRRIAGRDRVDYQVSEALSHNGRQIVTGTLDQAEALDVRVVDLQGRVLLDGTYQHLRGDVMGDAGGRVYVGGRGGVHVIEEGTGAVTRVVRRPVGLVDVRHDLVFVGGRQHPGRVGPTSLAHPGTPRWRARFVPVAVAPDGRHVVGRDGTVRAMTDGHVVRRVPVARWHGLFHFLGWASKGRVLLERTAGRTHTLVSCGVPTGACHRVGSTTRFVSLPTSAAGPYRQP